MARQCLERCIPGMEAAARHAQRNRDGARVDWRLTTADARISLNSLYLIYTTPADCYGGAAADWSDSIRMLRWNISPFAL